MNNKQPNTFPVTTVDRLGSLPAIAVIYAIAGFMTLLGHQQTLALGKKLGDMLYYFSTRIKAKVFHNLKLAYGDEIIARDMEKLARTVLQNFCQNWTELFFTAGPLTGIVLDRITIEGRENLDKALSRGKGVIAISAHLGNYPLIGTKLAQENYSFRMVVRTLKSRSGSVAYAKGRRMIELPSLATTPERQFYKEALKVLHSNGILGMISDENKRRGGIFVDFFGRPAATAPGPAALALRTDAAVVPIFIVRCDDGSQKICIEPEITRQRSGDDQKDGQVITAGFTKVIEDYVRRYPSQWVWTNWRWRTQPWGQSAESKIKKKRRLKSLARWIKSSR